MLNRKKGKMKNFQWKKIWPHLIAIAVFILVAVLFCKPSLEGKVLQQSDVIHWKGMSEDLFRYKAIHGNFPLWNNNLFGGIPAYQIAMESNNPVSIGIFHSIFTLFVGKPIGYFFLLCISFYFLTQVLSVNSWLGILGSIAYAFASYSEIIISVGHDTKVQAMGYLPALLGAIYLLYRKKYWSGTALTALFAGLLLEQNHLQITYYFLIVAFCMTVGFVVIQIKKKEYRHMVIAIALALIAGAIGACCNMVNLATTEDYSKATMRNGTLGLDTTTMTQKKTAGLPLDYAFNWSYGKAESFTLLVPNIYGGASGGVLTDQSHVAKLAEDNNIPEDQATQLASNLPTYWGAQQSTSGPVYLGAIICFLFIFGMFYLKTEDKWWILAACILAVVMSWGKNFAGFNDFLFNHLPYYNKFRAPSMILIIPQLLFPVIAVLGLQQFFDPNPKEDTQLRMKAFKKAAILTGGILFILLLFYMSASYETDGDQGLKNYFLQAFQGNTSASNSFYEALKQDRKSLFGHDLWRSFIYVALSAGLMLLFLKKKMKAVYCMAGLIILSSADILSVGSRYLNSNNYMDEETLSDNYFKPTQADLQIMQDKGYFRVLNISQGIDYAFNDALTSYYHHSVGGYHPAKLSIVEDLLNFQLRKQPMNEQVLNMLNTKYIIVQDPHTSQPKAELNPYALGPCWFVNTVEFKNSAIELMHALDHFTPADTAFVASEDKDLVKGLPLRDSTDKINLVKNDNDDILYQSNSKESHFAVFSEIYYNRGWKAYIDGKEVPIIRTNYVLRGLSVPAGKHEITFKFHPASYYSSLKVADVASSIVWILLIIAAFKIVVTERRKTNFKNN